MTTTNDLSIQLEPTRLVALVDKLPVFNPAWPPEFQDAWFRCFQTLQQRVEAALLAAESAKAVDAGATKGEGSQGESAQDSSSSSSALASSPPASALRLSPEVEAIIARVVAQPQREMSPDEMRAWAQRLAEDVADAPEPYTVASPPASAPPSKDEGRAACEGCDRMERRLADMRRSRDEFRAALASAPPSQVTFSRALVRRVAAYVRGFVVPPPSGHVGPSDWALLQAVANMIEAQEHALIESVAPASAPQGDTHDTTNEKNDAR